MEENLGLLLTEDLLKVLHHMFPPKNPTLGMTNDHIWYQAGQRSVVEILQSRFDESRKNILES